MNSSLAVIDALIANRLEQKKGVYFLDKHLETKVFCSYSLLFSKALSIKSKIDNLGIEPGKPVLLVYDQGIDFLAALLGCFMAKVIAVPCYPPFTKPMISRFINIIKTVKPDYIFVDPTTHNAMRFTKLFNNDLLRKIANWFMKKRSFATLDEKSFKFQIIETSEILDTSLSFNSSIVPNPEDIAFLQYTSGSIGQPKGVVIKHKNLINNLESMMQVTKVTSDSKIFSWLPQYHDMGLVGSLILAVHTGCNLYLTSPLNFIKSPTLWLKGITKFKITHTAAPNFAYDLVSKKITDEELMQLDLSSLVAIVNGAEPIKPSTIKGFIEKFKIAKFDAKSFALCYGLAEATLMVSINHGQNVCKQFCLNSLKNNLAVEKNDLESMSLINCGSLIPEHHVHIIDSVNKSILPESHIGEIWLSGKSIFEGYWNNLDATHRFFEDEKRYYFNTGDLGFVVNNNLFVTGRSKDLIIKNGLNFYPQDIEHIVEENCFFVKRGRCVAFLNMKNSEDKVVFIFEYANADEEKNFSKDSEKIQQRVFEFLGLKLDSIVALEKKSIQKTTSGKLQRQLMKELYNKKHLKMIDEVNL